MADTIQLDSEKLIVFEQALRTMTQFNKVFGKSLSPDFVAELHAAKELGLEVCRGLTQEGYDAVSSDGTRYQVKQRSPTTHNIDVRNFTFDYLVLVNLDADFSVEGMWLTDVEQVREIATYREKYLKYQVNQDKLKAIAKRLR